MDVVVVALKAAETKSWRLHSLIVCFANHLINKIYKKTWFNHLFGTSKQRNRKFIIYNIYIYILFGVAIKMV